MFAKLDDDAREHIRAIVEAGGRRAARRRHRRAEDRRLLPGLPRRGGREPAWACSRCRARPGPHPQAGQQARGGPRDRPPAAPAPAPAAGRAAIDQDAKEATAYILYLHQAGLGLPDRDYYLTEDPKMEAARQAYRAYVEKHADPGRPQERQGPGRADLGPRAASWPARTGPGPRRATGRRPTTSSRRPPWPSWPRGSTGRPCSRGWAPRPRGRSSSSSPRSCRRCRP